MNINNLFKDFEEAVDTETLVFTKNGSPKKKKNTIATEHFVDVYINDVLSMKLVCSPSYLAELVLGRLYTEGFIDSLHEIRQLSVCEHGLRVKVFLNKKANCESSDFVETTSPCCTGNHILTDVFRNQNRLPKPVEPIEWHSQAIFDMATRFYESTPLFDATRSVHSCYLYQNDQLIVRCEDLGRHNAVDKVVGYALTHDIDLTKCTLFSSGRIPTDMISKVVNARIPILVTKTTVTDEAISLARDFHITLIIYAKEDSFELVPMEINND
ncbi:formate dehydrogenase accessory sulfurtransferase FdhD [Eubacterium oxidoreducens]|uniref:FdhD protein n=1 Tax=Eubacterium oxidoreducens TaxID=1732 RepID=A0A1G6CB77_EUBOX|nr:formate dehydrogenase accessory sulfurtransferase FdhD [Eubacterium oxidoreducens]SDB30052.1 FdhD protein [Eubacterium oxidoreducens]